MSAATGRVAGVLFAALATALTAAACGAAPEPASAADASTATVVALAPAGTDPLAIAAAARFPSGSRVVRLDGETRTELTTGLDAAGAPSVRFDGERILFVGRDRPDGPFLVWECGARGEGRRVAVRHDRDCTGAAFLPDGRVVYAADTDDPSPAGKGRGSALFVGKNDGAAGARITWGGLDVDPTVLSDGRVLFATWRPATDDSRGDAGRFVLCTVAPDGTGFAPFHVEDDTTLRPRQLPSLDVRFSRAERSGAVTDVAAWDVPSRCLGSAGAPATVEVDGAVAQDVLPLAARTRPQGHLSSVRADAGFATLVAVDARFLGKGTVARFTSGDRAVGDVPLAADGSFSVRVPADQPLRIAVLDEEGRTLSADRGPFWLRPGETRVCVRCHDDAESGPPNVRPIALTRDPVDLVETGDAHR